MRTYILNCECRRRSSLTLNFIGHIVCQSISFATKWAKWTNYFGLDYAFLLFSFSLFYLHAMSASVTYNLVWRVQHMLHSIWLEMQFVDCGGWKTKQNCFFFFCSFFGWKKQNWAQEKHTFQLGICFVNQTTSFLLDMNEMKHMFTLLPWGHTSIGLFFSWCGATVNKLDNWSSITRSALRDQSSFDTHDFWKF